jgi:hypothetical protein
MGLQALARRMRQRNRCASVREPISAPFPTLAFLKRHCDRCASVREPISDPFQRRRSSSASEMDAPMSGNFAHSRCQRLRTQLQPWEPDDVDSPAILYLELFRNLPTITLMRSRRYVYWTRLSLNTFGVYTPLSFYTPLGFCTPLGFYTIFGLCTLLAFYTIFSLYTPPTCTLARGRNILFDFAKVIFYDVYKRTRLHALLHISQRPLSADTD